MGHGLRPTHARSSPPRSEWQSLLLGWLGWLDRRHGSRPPDHNRLHHEQNGEKSPRRSAHLAVLSTGLRRDKIGRHTRRYHVQREAAHAARQNLSQRLAPGNVTLIDLSLGGWTVQMLYVAA